MKKPLLFFIVLYIFLSQNTTIFAEPTANINEDDLNVTAEAYVNEEGDIVPPSLLCEGAVLINADNGDVLFSKNMNLRLYPASMTKVMTAILTLENGGFEDAVYFSDNAVRIEPGSSSIGIKPGEILSLDEALNGLMITSANEVANALAEHVSGSIEAFCLTMTDRAHSLGAYNTNFLNPHGLHDDNHFTTPYDMALIFRQGLEYPYFKDVIKRHYFQIPPTNITDVERNLYTRNRIIMNTYPEYYYQYCEGGKTGFTDQAMQTLVTYAQKDGVNLIAVIMKAPSGATYTDSIALYEYGFNFFKTETVFEKNTFTADIPVYQSNDKERLERGMVTVSAKEDLSRTLRRDILEKGLTQRVMLPEKLETPVMEGETIGSILLLNGNEKIASISLVAANSISSLTTTEIKEMKREEFIADTKKKLPIYLTFIPVIILAVWIAVSLIIKARKRKKERNRFGFNAKSKYRLK